MNKKPVIIVAVANDRQLQGRYLRALGDEINSIREALNNCLEHDIIELEILPNATWESILGTFRQKRFRDRIAIFHYAGHAEDYSLLLEASTNNVEKIHASGFVSLLASTQSLKMVFLNGCSTLAQSEAIRSVGIPSVIGTNGSINDQLASEVALHFYEGLGKGLSIIKSWEITVAALKGKYGLQDISNYYRTATFQEGALMQMPWQILFASGKEAVKEWNIPQGSNDPLFGLPGLDERYGYPENPYRYLEAYTEKDARIFFGRNTYVRDLYHWFIHPPAPRVLLLHGYSGVGKSSLLAAGVIPRVKSIGSTVIYISRNSNSLSGALAKAIDLPFDASISNIQEKLKTYSSCLVIIDQAEDVFLQTTEIKEKEFREFHLLANSLFHSENPAKGVKILLSFRKEYYAEFTQRLSNGNIAFTSLFVDHFVEADIHEIVGGLQKTAIHRSNYQLTVDTGLSSIISADLLKDKEGNIAPTLQIILTKLWNEEKGKTPKHFSLETYRQLTKKGVLLTDFLDQQLDQLYRSSIFKGALFQENGLVLDVLYMLTTDHGTSTLKSFGELKERYANTIIDLRTLLNQMVAIRLLAIVSEDNYRLIHDSLAPLIRIRWAKSEASGQRALRILNNKTREYELHADTYLNEQELHIVEKGMSGMRILDSTEQKILEYSRAFHHAKQTRNLLIRIFSLVAIGAIILLAFISTMLWRESLKEANINQLVVTALQIAENDATTALDTLSHALAINSDNISAKQARYDIFRKNEFYQYSRNLGGAVQSIDMSSLDKSSIVAAKDTLYLFDSTAHLIGRIPHPSNINRVKYISGEASFISSCDDGNSYLYNVKGLMPVSILKQGNKKVTSLTVSKSEPVKIFTGDERGLVLIWNKEGTLLDTLCQKDAAINSLSTTMSSSLIAVGYNNGIVEIWDYEINKKITQTSFPQQINSLAFVQDDTSLLVGTRSSKAVLWSIYSDNQTEFVGHSRRINEGVYFPGNQVFFTASDDGEIRSWDQIGNQKNIFRGHNKAVVSLAGCQIGDDYLFISGGLDGTIKWWQYQSKITRDLGYFSPSVFKATYYGDKIVIGHTKRLNLESINDMDFDADQFFDLLDAVETYPISFFESKTNERKTFTPPSPVVDFQITPNNTAIFSIHQDNTLRKLNIELSTFDTICTVTAGPVAEISVDGKGERLAIGTETGTILLLNKTEDDKVILNSEDFITDLEFGASNDMLFSVNISGNVQRWNLKNLEGTTLCSVNERVEAISITPDEKYIAIGSSGLMSKIRLLKNDGQILWEKDLNATNRVGANGIYEVAFSFDGKVVAVGTLDGRVIIFDMKGVPVQEFEIPGRSQIKSIQFSSDNTQILVSNEKGLVVELAIFE